ncbi:hypothetical protein FA09DRAFT_332561 [Tilletiopsis washingtonensis]|uniref:Ubiquitin-like domain-containing protein n=1 Tax=Tilletiopsis washingtonensis TaxID=58919 RepID=A0A316Z1D9_9BASI|nr:hypothetical protein FA09DRAFT_332561 [Tilletiopsis washingtonensis]PWN94904.1 hypothetical protein FA09DRAFT_332561 [Tilletiopsis washingtonensis]
MGVRKSGTSLEAESADTVIVTVKTMTGSTYHFNASKRASVGKFRRRFSEHTGIPTDQLRLVHDGRRIQDDEMMDKIGDLAQGDDAITIYAVLCMCGC